MLLFCGQVNNAFGPKQSDPGDPGRSSGLGVVGNLVGGPLDVPTYAPRVTATPLPMAERGDRVTSTPARDDSRMTSTSVVEDRVTLVPTAAPTEQLEQPITATSEAVRVFVASYYPDLADLWCLDYADGRCVSSMTSGEDWREYVGRAAACPVEWLGMRLDVVGLGVYTCLDTGQGARCEPGFCTVYVLSDVYLIGMYDAVLEG